MNKQAKQGTEQNRKGQIMALRTQKVIERVGNWVVKEETLSDSSCVYNVQNRYHSDAVAPVEIAAVDLDGAMKILEVLNNHAV